MKITFVLLKFPEDTHRLISFLTSDSWPFHVNQILTYEKVTSMIAEGLFDGTNHESFLILNENNSALGFIRLFDLDDIDDGYPMFDLRIKSEMRGRRIGKEAMLWLSKYAFIKWPLLDRLAGTTRADNVSMRKLFKASGYVKEGHFRKSWAVSENVFCDTVKYCLLREDWESNKSTPVNWDDE